MDELYTEITMIGFKLVGPTPYTRQILVIIQIYMSPKFSELLIFNKKQKFRKTILELFLALQ